jgi:hypothetical protein
MRFPEINYVAYTSSYCNSRVWKCDGIFDIEVVEQSNYWNHCSATTNPSTIATETPQTGKEYSCPLLWK